MSRTLGDAPGAGPSSVADRGALAVTHSAMAPIFQLAKNPGSSPPRVTIPVHWMNCSACTRRPRRAIRSAMDNAPGCPNPLDVLQLRTHDSHRAAAFEKINFDGTKLPMVVQAYWATANGRNRPFRPNLTIRNLPPFLTIMSLFGQTFLSFLH